VCYIFLLIILSVGGVVPIDSETFLMTNLINLKIKPAQSFKFTHRNRIYVYVFIRVSAHIYIHIYKYLCLYCINKRTMGKYHHSLPHMLAHWLCTRTCERRKLVTELIGQISNRPEESSHAPAD
jgi:hypothetical protein